MADNKTSIIISATDETHKAVDSAVAGFDRMKASAASMSTVLGGIGAGLSMAGFVATIKKSIDAADALNDLSKKYGASVETLAGFNLAAEKSGTNMESVAKALNKLSREMTDAPEKFEKLGISSKNSTTAMVQLADIFAAMPEGAERTALAIELFGKAGADMIPMLSEGSAGLKKMLDEGAKLSRVTKELAINADEFNDNLATLKAASTGAGMAMTKELLGPLTEISRAMAEAAREGGTLQAIWVGLGGLGAAIFTSEFDSASKKIIKLRGELGDLERHREELRGGGYLQKWLYGNEKDIDARIAATRKQISDLTASMNKPASVTPNPRTADDEAKALRASCTLRGGRWVNGKCEKAEASSAPKVADIFIGANGENIYERQNAAYVTKSKDTAKFIEDQIKAANELNKAMYQDGVKAAEEYQKRLDALISDTPIIKTEKLLDDIGFLDNAFMDGKISAEVWSQTVSNATGKMAENGKNDFEELQRAIEGWGKASADAMVEFAFTGKMSFGDMVDSILKDIARMMVYKNVTEPLFKSIGGSDFVGNVASMVFGGGRASGGSVNPGQFYVVGEKGPEMLVPNTAGRVIPNSAISGGGGNYNVSVSVDARGGQVSGDNAQASELGRRIEAAVRGVLLAEKRPGGMLAA